MQCLKYLVLAAMLAESKVDPFDAQEAKPYKADPEVAAMTRLVEARPRGRAHGRGFASLFFRSLSAPALARHRPRSHNLKTSALLSR